MASVAICTAVSNPKVKSVADRSLSIVFGTPTMRTPSSVSRLATPRVSSPPMATRQSTRSRFSVSSTRRTPSSDLVGVGPGGAEDRAAPVQDAPGVADVRSIVWHSTTPRQP